MRNLNTSAISSQAQLPVKSGTLVHLQAAYKEALDALARGLVTNYLANTAYRLYGLVNSGTLTDYNISAGAIFFNGEIYLVDSAIFSVTGSNVAVANITTSFFNDPTADPVTFTDGNARSVHEIRKIVISAGLSGSGIANFSDLRRSTQGRSPRGSAVAYYPPSGTLNDFDASGKGISGDVIGWALCNGNNGTISLKGRVIAGYDPSDSSFSNVGLEAGEKAHVITKQELPNITLTINSQNGNAVKYGAEVVGANNVDNTRTDANNAFGNIGWKTEPMGSSFPHNNLQPYKVLLYIQEID